MIIKSKLSEQDFINVNFVLLYSKTSMKIFTGLICIFLLASIMTVAFLPGVTYTQLITPTVMLIAMPLLTWFTAKKNYASNQRTGETVEYQFEKDNLIMKGESFNSQLSWDKIYKVTQTKNWLLIWQSRQLANPIPLRDIWEGEMADLQLILEEHGVKNNLQN